MEKFLNVVGTVNQIKELFENSNALSVRHYKAKEDIKDEDLDKSFKFEVNIRCSRDLYSQVSKVKKASELLKINKGAITKDNMHLYYEFLSDEDLVIHQDILNQIFLQRSIEMSIFKDGLIHSVGITNTKGDRFIKCECFGIKDTLKPVDEYIKEIKASSEYKEYALNLDTVQCNKCGFSGKEEDLEHFGEGEDGFKGCKGCETDACLGDIVANIELQDKLSI